VGLIMMLTSLPGALEMEVKPDGTAASGCGRPR